MIRDFEAKARDYGASPEHSYAARYALCALLDETVLTTPWGSQSIWSEHSVLATLHNETYGGERFFQILSRMMEQPAQNIDLLEFLYVCLSLGFQGKFAVMERGTSQLDQITQNLYRTIINQKGDAERDLSPHWRGLTDRRPIVSRYVPLWVIAVLLCVVGILIFFGLNYSLNRKSDLIFAKLNSLSQEAPHMSRAAAATPLPPEPVKKGPDLYQSMRRLLDTEVRHGKVQINKGGNAVKITLLNKGMFRSGSATIAQDVRPLIQKIGAAIRASSEAVSTTGPVLITGHTDNQPIRTLRFPSNWHLSSARAIAVASLLARSVGNSLRLVPEGRADTEPIAPNKTAQGRELNRRVEISIPAR